jgi:peptide deformylase
MGTEQIVRYGNKVLNEQTREVAEITDEIRELIPKMYEIMHESNGVGLAANQIGVPLRMFVYDIGEGPHTIINGKITKKSGKQTAIEGCLSIPGLQGEVTRAETVTISGLDENGAKVRLTGEGLLARVFQHETDHLEGTLFIDRAHADTLEWIMLSQEEEADAEDAEDAEEAEE